MGNVGTFPVAAPRRETKVLTGNFTCNGSSAVATSTIKGDISSVTRDGTGTYTITLKQSWRQVGYIGVSLVGSGDQYARVKSQDVANGTFVIEIWDLSGGAVADSASDVVYVHLDVLNTGVGA